MYKRLAYVMGLLFAALILVSSISCDGGKPVAAPTVTPKPMEQTGIYKYLARLFRCSMGDILTELGVKYAKINLDFYDAKFKLGGDNMLKFKGAMDVTAEQCPSDEKLKKIKEKTQSEWKDLTSVMDSQAGHFLDRLEVESETVKVKCKNKIIRIDFELKSD